MADDKEPEEEMVTISRRQLEALESDSEFLECLQREGVDNWEGYGAAQDLMSE